jgi:hypothetical protein
MRYRLITVIVLVEIIAVLVWLGIFLEPNNARAAQIQVLTTPLSTTTANTSPPTSAVSGFDPAIIAALIGLAGVVVGALIAGAFALYQIRRNVQIEQKRQAEQFQHDQEMELLRKELEAQYKAKEQEDQLKKTKAEMTQASLLDAKSVEDCVQIYRKKIHTDPRIARLQILDMDRPLEVTDIYIRVRLHQETRLSYELDATLRDAEVRQDPNELLKASQVRLESRASAAIDPGEAIRKYKHCVIVGDPGAGKTTMLKYLTLQAADGQLTDLPDLPIHVELNNFATSTGSDLLEFAASEWDVRYVFPKAEALNYMQASLQEGKALVLLDALDETVTGKTKEEAEESYKQAADAIMELATRYPEAPIAVTVRKAGYHQRAHLTGFTELEVLDFRPEEIKQFVNQWFACHPNPQKRANAIDLNTRLERNSPIQALAANPLLLSLIVIVYEDQLDLPDRRAELYKQCVDTLLTKWDASRNIHHRREFKPEHKRQLLEEVAWHFHLQGQRYFHEEELLSVIAAFLPAVGLSAEQKSQILAEIAAENGLLKEQARGWHGFLHLTLQEYFVAQYAVDHHQVEPLLAHRGEPWWEEVILLYAGRTPDASPLLRKLLGLEDSTQLREDMFHTNLILAGRCLATHPVVWDTSLRELVASHLFDTLTRTPYSLTQEQIVNTLAEIGGTEVNKRLLLLLHDEHLDSYNRANIAFALGTQGDRSIIPDLLPLLSDEHLDFSERMSIASALGTLGDRSITPDLLPLLSKRDLNSYVRMSIASTLGTLGDRSIIPDLLPLLADEHLDFSVRMNIASALGTLGDRSITSDLLSLLANEHLASDVCWSIADTIGQLADDEATTRGLAELLRQSDIADNIYRALWTVSRRARVRVFMADYTVGSEIQIVKWENESATL